MSHRIVAASTALQTPIVVAGVPDSLRLSEIVRVLIEQHGLPRRFLVAGTITIDGMPVPRNVWRLVRPKGGLELHFFISPAGGGGGGDSKNILGLVASVFLVVATAGIAAGALGPAGFGLFGANFASGALGAQLAAAAVGVAGQLAINALIPPPVAQEQSAAERANSGSLAGNVLSPGQVIPRVAGTLRVPPPMLCQPHTYQIGDDVFVDAVLAMAGPHAWSEPQAGGVPVSDLNDVQVWFDDGTAAARVNQFSAQAHNQRFGTELVGHKIRMGETGYNDRELVDQETPNNSLPKWKRFVTRRNCDYADVNLVLGGLQDNDTSGAQVIWLRLRGRKVGDSAWKNVQTLCYVGKGNDSFRRRIRLHFAAYPGSLVENPKVENGFLSPVTLLPVTNDHVNFKSTDSSRFPAAYSYNFVRQREGIDVWLNNAYFTAADQRYEFELSRSEMCDLSDFDGANDTARRASAALMKLSGGEYRDYFDAKQNGSGNWATQENTDDRAEVVIADSVVCVWNEPPIPEDAPIATAQVRFKNQQIEQMSFLLSGLVPDLSDGEWAGQVATSNPAAHFRYALTGDMTAEPVEVAYVDDDTLADWHAECATQGHECNMQLDGDDESVLDGIAACGRARRSSGYKFGVIWHRDTSGETPTQLFSARNIRNLSWSLAYSERPLGFSVRFLNADKNYEPDELLVLDPSPIAGATSDIEGVTYQGKVTEAEVIAQAEFDFAQLSHGLRWQFEIAIEQLATMPGELAKLSHDALHRHAGYARIVSVDSGTTFTVDADIGPQATDDFFAVDDLFAAEDVFVLGADWGVEVRAKGVGTLTKTVGAYAARQVTVDDTTGMEAGDLVVSGPVGTFSKRIQVLKIEPRQDLQLAVVTAQNEFLEDAA